MIVLYGGPTPNARKIAIALEEMELPWRLELIDMLAGDQLTPEFQEASGGYEGYIGWWGQVRSAELAEVSSDPSDLTVGYTVNYVMKSGRRDTDRIRLQLQRLDDRYLIAGEG